MDALASVATVLSAFGAGSRQATTALSQGPIARLPTAVTIVTTPAAFTIAPPFIKATPSTSWCADSHLMIEFHGNDRWQQIPASPAQFGGVIKVSALEPFSSSRVVPPKARPTMKPKSNMLIG